VYAYACLTAYCKCGKKGLNAFEETGSHYHFL